MFCFTSSARNYMQSQSRNRFSHVRHNYYCKTSLEVFSLNMSACGALNANGWR